jgi:mannose-6-phosphate isomerase-like protein (cupin superfamily)
MTPTQKTTKDKAGSTGRTAAQQEKPAAKRNTSKKNTENSTPAALKITTATSSSRPKTSGDNPRAVPGGKKAADGKTVSVAEEEKARSMHSRAKKNAQQMKNDAKLDSRFLHKEAGMKAHTISQEEEEQAHAIHSRTKKRAQLRKNDAKLASHDLHRHAGTGSHILSDKEKATAIKAGSPDAKVVAHNPHKHPGINLQKITGPGKTSVRKTGKNGFVADLEEETRKNVNFRRVLYTGKNSQLVLMALKPGEDIGLETHEDIDQFFRFEKGEGVVEIDGIEHRVKDGSGVIVPCGALHNVTNTSETEMLKLYTISSPPEHQDKIIRKTKREALAGEEHFDGRTTEKYH